MTCRTCRPSRRGDRRSTGSPAAGTSAPSRRGWRAEFGLLAVNTTLYVGPLADLAGGVDLSTIGSAALAGFLYSASRRKNSRHAAQMGHFATARGEN